MKFEENHSRQRRSYLYIDDIPTPYRVDVHKYIQSRLPGKYKVLFLADAEPGRTWDFNLNDLEHEVLEGRQLRPWGQTNPFSFKWNKNIVKVVEAYRPTSVALSGYAHPSVIRVALWCRRNGIPYGVASETSARSSATNGLRWKLRKLLIGNIVRGMSFGLPVGKEAASFLRKLGADNCDMFYFPNTPNTDVIVDLANNISDDVLLHKIFKLPQSCADLPLFSFFGRMIDAKRPQDALDAFKRLPPGSANLLMVGDGPLLPRLKKSAAGNQFVHFLGWVPDRRHIAKLMERSTSMLLPSVHEPWGAVVNEALALGTPPICSSNVTSAVELVDPGVNGFVYPVGDIDALRRCMQSMMEINKSTYQNMQGSARSLARKYDHKYAAENLIKALLSTIQTADSKLMR